MLRAHLTELSAPAPGHSARADAQTVVVELHRYLRGGGPRTPSSGGTARAAASNNDVAAVDRQLILRELGVLDLCAGIIRGSLGDGSGLPPTGAAELTPEQGHVLQLARACYDLLCAGFQDNPSNALYCAEKWMAMFLRHMFLAQDVHAEGTVKALLEKNRQILYAVATDENVNVRAPRV